jgi:hypothetical protein
MKELERHYLDLDKRLDAPVMTSGQQVMLAHLRLVHTGDVTAYREAVSLQVTDTIRS